MKKILFILLIFAFVISGVFAGNVYYAFGDIGQHPDILLGFFPSYAYMGVGVKLPQLSEDNTTDIQVLAGSGYLQRLLWQDKDNGNNNYDEGIWDKDSALRYNTWTNDLTFRFRHISFVTLSSRQGTFHITSAFFSLPCFIQSV